MALATLLLMEGGFGDFRGKSASTILRSLGNILLETSRSMGDGETSRTGDHNLQQSSQQSVALVAPGSSSDRNGRLQSII